MSTPEQQAEELLKCTVCSGLVHALDCPYRYRPAVAAALGAKDAENNDLRSLDDLHRRHELVPNNEVGCSCPSCNLHNRYRTEIEQWKLVKEANDNGLNALIVERDAEIERLKSALEGSRMWREDSNQKRLKLIEEVAQLRSQLAVAMDIMKMG